MQKKHNPLAYFFRQIEYLQVPKDNSIIITGFPYDEGTRLNNGRIGAEKGPKFFRDALNSSEFKEIDLKYSIQESLDLQNDLDLPAAHQAQTEKIIKLFSQNSTIFSIGGSNDQSYPNAKALLESYKQKIGVINIDAHMDVRPLLENNKAHSGSPFRLLIQDEIFIQTNSKFVNFANQGSQCSFDHFRFVEDNGHQVIWLNKHIRRHQIQESSIKTQAGQLFQKVIEGFENSGCQYIFVSFDVDSINSAFLPGVSAPSVIGGLTIEEAVEIMKISGENKKVKMLDFSEFNPAVENQLTSKLLAELFYQFCVSYNSRF